LKRSWTHFITPFTFSRSGWSVVRSASFVKGGTSKKRPLPHLHKATNQSNKVSSRTFQTSLVYDAPVPDLFLQEHFNYREKEQLVFHFF
jgi:hypothetical protein